MTISKGFRMVITSVDRLVGRLKQPPTAGPTCLWGEAEVESPRHDRHSVLFVLFDLFDVFDRGFEDLSNLWVHRTTHTISESSSSVETEDCSLPSSAVSFVR